MKTPIDLFILNPHTYRWKEVPKPRTDSAEAEDWPYQRYGHTVKGVHHMVGCMSKSYGRVAENHGLSYGRPLYHVMSGCYRFLEVSTI